MRNFSLYLLFSTLLTKFDIVWANDNPESNLSSIEEWKRSLIENTGCPFVSEDQMLVRNVCLMPYYQPNESPHLSNSTHNLAVNLREARVLKIDEANNKLTIDISQHLHWFDHRIRANFSDVPEEVDLIKLSPSNTFQIWHPERDLITSNLLKWESLYEPNLYKDIVVMYDYGDQNESFAELIAWKDWRATILCEFDFATYPFDTQTCSFLQTIDSNSMTELQHFDNMTDIEYTAVGFEIEVTLTKYDENATEMGFNITLRRIVSPYIYQNYIPCAAIVVVSQVSFMIPQESIPGRISLIATQFLTLTNVFIYQLSHSPSGTQLNALEIYTLTSLFFVLGTLIEFGILLALKRAHLLGNSQNKIEHVEKRSLQGRKATISLNQGNASGFGPKGYSTADKIDFASFVIFMFSFIVFNCVYLAQYAN